MAREDETAKLLKEGNSPSQIAEKLGIATSSVLSYLKRSVGEGRLFRYEILLGIERESREIVESILEQALFKSVEDFFNTVYKALEDAGRSMDHKELFAYLELRDKVFADMYEILRKIETNLHMSIRKALVEKYGQHNWWREGVPENIRAECAAARERDPHPAQEAYCYTTLIHLKEIYDKQWSILSRTLPPEVSCHKAAFLSNLIRLNRIRNSVMHPVRNIRLKDDDFEFVQTFKESLALQF